MRGPLRILSILAILLFSPLSSASNHIATVALSVWTGYPENVRGFKTALEQNGWVEGENIHYTLITSNGSAVHQRNAITKLHQQPVSLIYSLTTTGTSIVKEHSPEDTPIVFSIVTYPADSGLIESMEYSGNNLVGTSNYVPLQHYVKLLQHIVPSAQKVAIFHRKGEPNSKIQAASMIRALRKKGIKGISIEANSIPQLRISAIEAAKSADVFMTTTDTLMQGGGEQALIALSHKLNIPILSSNKKGIEQGSTFGPVADFYTLGVMAGNKAARILAKQATPTQLQSEYQNPPVLLVNKESAVRLGLPIERIKQLEIQWVQ